MNRHTGVVVVDGLNRKPQTEAPLPEPKTVVSAKFVDLVLLSYTTSEGKLVTQLAIKGDNTLMLLDSRPFGISKDPTPQQPAPAWLKNGVFEKLANQTQAGGKTES